MGNYGTIQQHASCTVVVLELGEHATMFCVGPRIDRARYLSMSKRSTYLAGCHFQGQPCEETPKSYQLPYQVPEPSNFIGDKLIGCINPCPIIGSPVHWHVSMDVHTRVGSIVASAVTTSWLVIDRGNTQDGTSIRVRRGIVQD